jgi:carbon monoxide dehydrogenase subunit G
MALNMTGEYVLAVPRADVWSALNDPVILKQCIPGCESFESLSGTEFSVVAKFEAGPVKARFKGRVKLEDLMPPESYTITGAGEGGVAGFAKGKAAVMLEEVPEGTKLTYKAGANVGGKIAQLGQRLLTGTAKKTADRFFANFANALSK